MGLKRLIVTATVLLYFSLPVMAGDYVGNGSISEMQNAYNGWILKTNGVAANPDGCEKNIIILESTHTQYKELYSILLSAYANAKPVNIHVDGCDANGYKKLRVVYSKWN